MLAVDERDGAASNALILKNAARQPMVRDHTIHHATASGLLAGLAAQDSSAALARRL
ncbi:hypothetical protein WMF04_46400 [Sorangium sp. So ce260]|uniref:hypothetical protein n=1 Tax=Sorangium sp. So ce260 TaxID=3133291 RepID=UPI003F63E8BB